MIQCRINDVKCANHSIGREAQITIQNSMSKFQYADSYENQPYWWRAAPRPTIAQIDPPRKIDVAVIGSGYTGLNAALQVARAGRSTLVLEANQLGYGCSSRNGGQIGTSLKLSYQQLTKKYGRDTAIRIQREGHRALKFLKDLIISEGIDCDLEQNGRYLACHNKKAFAKLAKEFAELPSEIAFDHHMVPPSEQSGELASDLFAGGCVILAHGAVHPAKYHQGLLNLVFAAGAQVVDQCAVLSVERTGSGFKLRTQRGDVDARDVVLATNGYTGKQFRWQASRLVPIGSFQIATETLPPSTIAQLIPKERVVTDTRLIGNYFRLSPDRTRLILGGRVTFMEATSQTGIATLYRQMIEVFPQLAGVRIDNSWVGYVAYTVDIKPHLGQHDGIYYCMGYCGSGVTLSSYFGARLGQKLLGLSEGKTELDNIRFRRVPIIVRNKLSLSVATRLLRVAEQFSL